MRLKRVNLRPERAYLRLGMANLRPGMVNLRPERAYFRPVMADSRCGRVNFRPERAILSLSKAAAQKEYYYVKALVIVSLGGAAHLE